MTTIHVSLDLETWGTTPGSDIRSIGACVFDPVTGNVTMPGYESSFFYIATDNPQFLRRTMIDGAEHRAMVPQFPLIRDPQTEIWWNEQSDAAKAAFTDPVLLDLALLRFDFWLRDLTVDQASLRLWSHGAAFDAPILAAAYAACNIPVPWHYRAIRDTRTLFDAAGITDHSGWLGMYATDATVQHHALDDAICQARAVCAAWRVLHPR